MRQRQIQQFLFISVKLCLCLFSWRQSLLSILVILLCSCASTKPPSQQVSLISTIHPKLQACLSLKQAQRVACLFEQYQRSNWKPKAELLVLYKDEYLSLLDLYHQKDRSKHRLKSEIKLLIYAKNLSSTTPSLLQLLPAGIPLSYESYDSRSFQLKESKNQPSWHEITLHDHRLIWLEIQLSKPIPQQFFWDKIPFFHLLPVFYQAFELQIPKGQPIFYLYHDLSFSQFNQNIMNYSMLRWEKEKQLAYQKNELYLSSFQHWDEISAFLRGIYLKDISPLTTSLTQPHFIGTDAYIKLKEAISQKFIELKKEYQYDKEYIYELSKVPLNTLYQPKALKNTIHDKKGDCKALTNLAIFELYQLLKSKFKNLPVSLAIGLTHDKMVAKESKSFPSLSWFNHIFLIININQQEFIYFDLTAEKIDSPKLKHKRVFFVDQQQAFWLD